MKSESLLQHTSPQTNLPEELEQLIDIFSKNQEQYHNNLYNEASLRQDFLDECIRLLGWDVGNRAHNAESFKEVVVESRLNVDGTSKAPDYCIQYGGRKLFFIEAKKPSVNIGKDTKAAFQVRRYGWSANMPLCILTDFEEWAVYDTSIKPKPTDKAHVGRVFYCRFDELGRANLASNGGTGWEYINSLFSKEAVLKGALENCRNQRKHGTIAVDDEFLNDIEEWREILAKDIAKNNSDLTERELNFAVQTTIDRIVFLRICEDRGIERENQLAEIMQLPNCYEKLKILFQIADNKYNSGLFHFRKGDGEDFDRLTLGIKIGDGALKTMIRGLYFPAPYQFAEMPASILGSVYERFLGKTIQLNARHQAKIESKPEVRKAGGVYYTPEYIVDHIVRKTVGEQLKNKTVKTIGDFRILDCACGSGSFLIVAYQYLLNWYLTEYMKNPEVYVKKKCLVNIGNEYKLTINERKRILTTHIFGVDLDAQAVEVTKLSLLLKTLENINEMDVNLALSIDRLLPNLGRNIKCGNSLIETDFYNQTTMDLGEEDQFKINAFDWKTEFNKIFADGGFDAVIGNPPYNNYSARNSMFAFYQNNNMVNELSLLKKQHDYCSSKYPNSSYGVTDLYKWFLDRALQLIKPSGKIGFIIPDSFQRLEAYKDVRSLYKNYDFYPQGENVFKQAVVPTGILIYPASSNVMKKNDQINLGKYKHILKEFVVFREGEHIPRSMLSDDSSLVPVTDSGDMSRYLTLPNKHFLSSGSQWHITEGDRIIIRKTGRPIFASIVSGKSYVIQNLYQSVSFVKDISPYYILGLLNSKFLTFVYRSILSPQSQGVFAQFRLGLINSLPMPNLDLNDKKDKKIYENFTALVERMCDLTQKKYIARDEPTKKMLERQIIAIDSNIDKLVYELYGLSDKEINLVETATNQVE